MAVVKSKVSGVLEFALQGAPGNPQQSGSDGSVATGFRQCLADHSFLQRIQIQISDCSKSVLHFLCNGIIVRRFCGRTPCQKIRQVLDTDGIGIAHHHAMLA